MFKRRTLGQSVWEFALLLSLVSATLVMMKLYLQRGLQARYKGGVDNALFLSIEREAASQGIGGFSNLSRQYDPYYRQSNMTSSTNSMVIEGYPFTSINETTRQSGWQEVNLPEAQD